MWIQERCFRKLWCKNRHLHEGRRAEPAICCGEPAFADRHECRSLDAAAIDGNSGVCRGSVGGGGRAGSERRRQAFQMDRRPGKRAECEQRQVDCHRGPNQPAAVHALCFALNQHLGNIGQTLTFTKPVYETANTGVAALRSLVGEINGGQVKQLVILGGNPAFTSPYDLHVGDAIKKVDTSIFVGADPNETWQLAKWSLPEAHYLECWGDAVAPDGTPSVQQPMIAPALRRQVAG